MKVAVVGVTGLVGTRMMEVLAERNFPVTVFLPVASERSVGRKVTFKGKEYTVISADDAIAARPDLALRPVQRACSEIRGRRLPCCRQLFLLENGPDEETRCPGDKR